MTTLLRLGLFFCFFGTIALFAESQQDVAAFQQYDQNYCNYQYNDSSNTLSGSQGQTFMGPPGPQTHYAQQPIPQSQTPITTPPRALIHSAPNASEGYTLNYENIQVVELIRFISQITGKNFIFNCGELDFCISIVSDEATNVDNLMTALLQILRVHGLNVSEEGNNILIYQQNSPVSRLSSIVTDQNAASFSNSSIITRVFRIYNIPPGRVAQIVSPLLSPNAVVEVAPETGHLIISDLTSNIDKVADLISTLDIPAASLEVGQYAVKSSYPQSLINIAFQILRPLAGDQILNMVVQPSSNTIFIVSTPYLVQRALGILQSLDTESIIPEVMDLPSQDFANTNFYVYKLRYHEGEDIAQAMRDIGANLQRTGLANMDLVSAIQSMQWVPVNNTLVFSGTDAAIDKIKKLLGDLDRAPKQVFIEVLIIDTTLSNSLDFGVEWLTLANEQNKAAIGFGMLDNSSLTSSFVQGARSALNCPPPNAARPTAGTPLPCSRPACGGTTSTDCTGSGVGDVPLNPVGFTLGVIGNIIRHNGQSFATLGALLHAVETEGNASVVLNPRILTEDTKEANVFVGQNIPYQTTNVVQKDTGTVTQNIQYEDIGIQLRVTPYVAGNNMVTLDIDQSISDSPCFTNSICGNPTSDLCTPITLTPVVNKTLTATRVHVPDRAFLILSGMVRDSVEYCWRGVPCLGSIPCIGPLFGNTIETREKRNLILFIRPVILDTPQEGIDLTNEEGSMFNWETNPCSIIQCGPRQAPESEMIINVHNHPQAN